MIVFGTAGKCRRVPPFCNGTQHRVICFHFSIVMFSIVICFHPLSEVFIHCHMFSSIVVCFHQVSWFFFFHQCLDFHISVMSQLVRHIFSSGQRMYNTISFTIVLNKICKNNTKTSMFPFVGCLTIDCFLIENCSRSLWGMVRLLGKWGKGELM